MSLASSSVVWSYAPQPAKIGEGGTFTVGDRTWYRSRTLQANAGTVQGQQPFPPELGGTIVTTGVFKDSVYYVADITCYPRLENIIGWLLEAAMGTASTVADSPVAGVNTHIFRIDPSNSFNLPWLASRTYIPGTTAPNYFGDIGFDCRVTRLRLGIPSRGKVTMNVTLLGRDVQYEAAPSWSYGNTLEDSSTTPNSGNGSFKVGGELYPITGLTIDIMNGLSTPQQEIIVGSYRMYDTTPLNRAAQLRAVLNWQDPTLYRLLNAGSSVSNVWSAVPFLQKTGAYHAVEGIFNSTVNIGATNTPYGLEFRANSINWEMDGGLSFQGGDLIRIPIIGTVVDPDAGDFAQLVVKNDATNYTWPT